MFVAVRPPESAVADLDAFLDVRREAGPFRWTPPEQFHVTLAFLGEVPDRCLDELAERLTRAAARRTTFTTALAGGGAFPSAARSRVLWAGLQLTDPAAEELRRLATGARAAAAKSGIAVEGRRFRPHLTLARLGTAQDTTRWVRLLDAYRGPTWAVDRIELVASYLGEGPRNRPRHEVVADYPLRPA